MDKMINKYQSEVTATGYIGLDNLLDGGIHKGLYLIKGDENNNLAHQLASTFAFNFNNIIYFSIDIDEVVFINKALTRNYYLRTGELKKIDFYTLLKIWKYRVFTKAISCQQVDV